MFCLFCFFLKWFMYELMFLRGWFTMRKQTKSREKQRNPLSRKAGKSRKQRSREARKAEKHGKAERQRNSTAEKQKMKEAEKQKSREAKKQKSRNTRKSKEAKKQGKAEKKKQGKAEKQGKEEKLGTRNKKHNGKKHPPKIAILLNLQQNNCSAPWQMFP